MQQSGLLLCWQTCKSSSFEMLSSAIQADFHYLSFVHIFINSFSIWLTLWADRYKIPAQRSKKVGLRKVLEAMRKSGESVLLTFIS
jgi:hypothetical protein